MPRSERKGYKTQPLKVGAPLPPDLPALPVPPTLDEIQAEIDRGEVELMYAIARERQAWALMRRRANERQEYAEVPGALAALESDPIWKQRTGDVTWWCNQTTMRSTTLLALHAMRADRREDEARMAQLRMSGGIGGGA